MEKRSFNWGINLSFIEKEKRIIGKLPFIGDMREGSDLLENKLGRVHEDYILIGGELNKRVYYSSALLINETYDYFGCRIFSFRETNHSNLIQSSISIIIEILKNEIQT